MMKKTLFYMLLAVKMVFLFEINLWKAFFKKVFKTYKWLLRGSLILVLILSSLNFEAYAQGNNCPPGQRFCRGSCQPARDCRPGVPPPPGLPIDSKLPYLLVAGLGLGIYYWKFKKIV